MKIRCISMGVAAATGMVCASVAADVRLSGSAGAGGGGTSTNGLYKVCGTIGQPDIGKSMSGGGYNLRGGFWSLAAALQTAGAPTLYITQTGHGLLVYWLAQSGWSLQQSGTLSSGASWSDSSGVTTFNGTNYLTLVNPQENLFFKLKSQSAPTSP